MAARLGLAMTAAGAVIGAAFVVVPSLVASVLPLLVSLLVVGVVTQLHEGSDKPFLSRMALLSFVLHGVVGVFIVASTTLTSYLGPDAVGYHEIAVSLMRHWRDPSSEFYVYPGKEGYFYFLAGLYWVFGPYKIVGVVVNALFAALLVPVVADSTRRLFGEQEARLAAKLVVFLPSFVLWPSGLLREAPILLMLAVGINCGIRLSRGLRAAPLVGFSAVIALLLTFRSFLAVVLVLGVTIALGLAGRGLTAIVGAMASSMLVLLVFTGGIGADRAPSLGVERLRQADEIRADSAQAAGTGFARDRRISTPGAALRYLAVGFPAVIAGPAPWQVRSVRQAPLLLDAMSWWVMLPLFVKGAARCRRRSRVHTLMLIIPAVLIALIIGLLVANYGTIVRARSQVLVILVPLAAGAWYARTVRPSTDTVEVAVARQH